MRLDTEREREEPIEGEEEDKEKISRGRDAKKIPYLSPILQLLSIQNYNSMTSPLQEGC